VRIASLPLLFLSIGCAAEAPETSASAERRQRVTFDDVQLYDAQHSSAELRVAGCTSCEVVLLAATSTGGGPCLRGVCLDLGPDAEVVDRLSVQGNVAGGSFNLGVFGVAGQQLALQAVLMDGRRPVARTPVLLADVEATVRGCTFPGDPSFDPAVTFNDGSCICGETTYISNAAELAAAAACTGVNAFEIRAFADPVAEVPGAPQYVLVHESPALTRLVLADAGHLTQLEVTDAPALAEVELPSLATANALSFFNLPSLTRLHMPLLTQADSLLLWGTALTSLDLPSWRTSSGHGEGIIIVEHLAPMSIDAPLADSLLVSFEGNTSPITLAAPAAVELGVFLGADANLVWSAPPQVQHLTMDLYDSDIALLDAGAATSVQISATSSSIQRVAAPFATSGSLILQDLPALTDVDAPLLADASLLQIRGTPSLGTLDLPSLMSAAYIVIQNNAGLQSVSLPSLGQWGSATLDNNPQWCVGAPFTTPPPGADVSGAGNLCDP
jgi:hypothetical protein